MAGINDGLFEGGEFKTASLTGEDSFCFQSLQRLCDVALVLAEVLSERVLRYLKTLEARRAAYVAATELHDAPFERCGRRQP